MKACVIIAKCYCNREYGIRIEKRGNDWVRTWAFPLSPEMKKNEHYTEDMNISGSLDSIEGYPGCPYCKTTGFFVCSCNHVNCWDGRPEAKCNWCGCDTHIKIEERFDVNAGQM